MRKAFYAALILFVLITGLMLGPLFLQYEGYILVVMENGTLQMSVFGFLILMVSVTLALWLTLWIWKRLFRVIVGSKDWVLLFSSRRRKQALTNGLIALSEGNYNNARKHLALIESEDFDGVNLLAAAEAEVQLGEPQRALKLWEHAQTYSKSQVAATLCLVRAYLSKGETGLALEQLQSLDNKHHSNQAVLNLWAQALAQAGRWQELKEKLGSWKRKLGDDYGYWMQQASQGTFAEIASKQGANELKRNWQALPRSAKKDPAQQSAYIQQLIDQGMHQDAEKELVQHQKSGPVSVLLPLFRQLKMPSPALAIKILEGWIKQDENNVELLSTLGELSLNSGDLPLAEKVLSKAVKLANNPEDLLLLSKIKELQDDQQGALQLYKQGSFQ